MRIIELGIQALNTAAALVVAYQAALGAVLAFVAFDGVRAVIAAGVGLVFSGLALANFRLFLYFLRKG